MSLQRRLDEGSEDRRSDSHSVSLMETIDISQTIIYHLSWKIRLREFLDGREDITESQAVSHRDCDLGKWLYSEAMEKYRDDREIRELEKLHTELHDIVKHVLQMKYSGNSSSAEKELTHMESLSEKIFSLLISIKQRVQ